MTFELLVSCVQKDARELIAHMNISSDAVIVSQLEDKESEEILVLESKGHSISNKIKYYKLTSKGVGLNRNTCLEKSTADIVLFSDEDILYLTPYEARVLQEFEDHPEADIILFNNYVCEERRTYWNSDYKRVRWYNCGRYPAYAIAARADKLKAAGVKYSHLFGGGAKYSNGEDSLFLMDCLKAGLRLMATPTVLGEEIPRPSTWFNGYNDKFFYDRGVLYRCLYGKMAKIFGLRWLLKMKPKFSGEYSYDNARKQLFKGIKDGIK